MQIHTTPEHEEQLWEMLPTLLEDLQTGARVDAFIFFDQHGACRYMSAGVADIFGLDDIDQLPTHFDTLHPGASTDTLHTHPIEALDGRSFEELLRQTSPLCVEFTTPEGACVNATLRSVHTHGAPLGLLVYYTSSLVPNQEALLETLLSTLSLGVVVVDQQGHVRYNNYAALEVTGRLDDGWETVFDPRPYTLRTPRGEEVAMSHGPIKRAKLTGRDILGETLLLDFGDGDIRRIVCDVRRVILWGETLYIASLRDITERYKREQRKDELLTIASHELRNPLTPLKGMLQLAIQQKERGEPVDMHLLERSLKQVGRLTRLIDGLLDLSRIETGRFSYSMRPTDLQALITDLLAEWRIRHPARTFLFTPSEPTGPELMLDPPGIEQVLNNLLDNAAKFSPADTPIEISLRTTGDDTVLIEVFDHGDGLDADLADRVFERFYQGPGAAETSGSLGLGLYICRQIIVEHNGSIRLRCDDHGRTAVEVSLPLR